MGHKIKQISKLRKLSLQNDQNIMNPNIFLINVYVMQEGYGIGDDEFSIAYDGCRNLIWYEAESLPHTLQQWKPGDILGCLLNVEKEEVVFSLNGVALPPNSQLFKSAKYVLLKFNLISPKITLSFFVGVVFLPQQALCRFSSVNLILEVNLFNMRPKALSFVHSMIMHY